MSFLQARATVSNLIRKTSTAGVPAPCDERAEQFCRFQAHVRGNSVEKTLVFLRLPTRTNRVVIS